ncbi:MAG: SGNH/GDSL hydrolase family protein [Deltaproteobacteria bacterium]|nr:SGNH/GDSL hydrolase family protein [Deltaproteobacteria bacterium]
MNQLPPSNRLIGFLLILSSVSLTLAVLCGSYLYFNFSRIKSLETELLSARAVQERLFQGQRTDHALYPHQKGHIGFVLNPHMEQATLWGLLDRPYPVNSLGLRGAPVKPKKAGVQRILLVGDSWFFGWLLEEKDKLEHQLRTLLSARVKGREYEVITVAMPGWNVRSQDAFLGSHWSILDPDFIIWAMCTNDAEDIGGVVPPGVLGYYLSPQNPESAPLTLMGKYASYPMPFVLERHRHNLQVIEEFEKKQGIGVLLLIIDIRPALFALVSERTPPTVPVLFLPFGSYAEDKRRLVSESPRDGHPSAWFNGIIALGLMHQMGKMQAIPTPLYGESDQEVLANFEAENRHMITDAEVDEYIRDCVTGTQKEYHAGGEAGDLPGFGISKDGALSDHGVLYLKTGEAAEKVSLDLAVPERLLNAPNTIWITVRDFEGRERSVEKDIRGESLSVDVELPLPRSRYPLVEVEWRFRRVACRTPYSCVSAILLRMYSN